MTSVVMHQSLVRIFSLCGLFGLFALVNRQPTIANTPQEESAIDFNSDIRPILSDHCFACHGPDANQRKGGLRLDVEQGAFQAADSGEPAIVAADVEASSLVARIESNDPHEVMPPPETHKPLSSAQKALLRKWVAQGAPYAAHWSLVPPKRYPAPQVAHGQFVKDEIDQFVLRMMLAAGLTPNEQADKNELIRRVTFDLTGLPPTIAEVQAFLQDESPIAYERLVDRLLDSPRFGEHMGRYWLDLVRYGDTHGLHLDNYREMWPYRDWVIRAFNDNIPFDQFIMEQVAGDLLPGDRLDSQVASGFNRLNVTTNEGGSIYEEVFARNVIDRTDAFGTVFLGLTVGCAVCHDHKFDPLSQQDYYSLSAFFNSLDGREMDGNVKDHPPTVRVPTEDHLEQLRDVRRMRADLQTQMSAPIPAVDAAQARWMQTLVSKDLAQQGWLTLQPSTAVSSGNSTMAIREDGTVDASGEVPAKETVTIEGLLPQGGAYQLIRLEVLTDSPDEPAGRSPNGNGVLSEFEVSIKSAATGNEFLPVKLVYADADHSQTDGNKFSVDFAIDGKVEGDAGWAIAGHQKPGPRSAWFVAGSLLDASLGEASIRVVLKYESQFAGHSFKQVRLSVSEDMPVVAEAKRLEIDAWKIVGPFAVDSYEPAYYQTFASEGQAFDVEATFNYRGQTFVWQPLEGYKPAVINALPKAEDRSSVVVLHQRIKAPTAQKVKLLLGTEDGVQVYLGSQKILEVMDARDNTPLADEIDVQLQAGDNDLYLKIVNHDGPASFASAIRSPAAPVPAEIVQFAKLEPHERSAEQAESLRDYFRQVVSIHPDWLVLRDMAEGLRKRVVEIENSMPTTLVWKELETPRAAHILNRGEYDQPGAVVARSVPATIAPFPQDAPLDRLGLALWLTSEHHPLTARVAVNRFWQQLFGLGIVRTSEDFGAQGSPPSHPQLLDTLALDFRENGWDTKQLMKRLVMTGTYRQSNRVTAAHLEKDPNNRLLSRGPRFRLEAEMIRDAALASSGLLVEKLGGPSVKPPQPAGLWRAVGYTSSNTAVFKPDEGEKVYRRSVYTFWKRTSSPPQMSTFDAPSRENCTARRERTNTPMQALMLLNEPQMMQSAKRLAERSLNEAGDELRSRIAWMYFSVVSRSPAESVLNELVQLTEDLVTAYQSDPNAVQQLGVETAEQAAETLVASTILNLDQALNK